MKRETKIKIYDDVLKLNINELTRENVFKCFSLTDKRIIFAVDENNVLRGIVTFKTFIENIWQESFTADPKCLSIKLGNREDITEKATEIYETYGILSDIPVVDEENRIVAGVIDEKILENQREFYNTRINEIRERLEKFKKSLYLKKEVSVFRDIMSGSKVYIKEGSEDFGLFEGISNDNIVYLSKEEFFEYTVKYMNNLENDEYKKAAVIDLSFGNGYEICRELGFYNYDKFEAEFLGGVENGRYSQLLRITDNEYYTIKDLIDEIKASSFKYVKNGLLSNFIYEYVKKLNITFSFSDEGFFDAIYLDPELQGVKKDREVNYLFSTTDCTVQQIKLNFKAFDKNIHIFNLLYAENANLTYEEKERFKIIDNYVKYYEDDYRNNLIKSFYDGQYEGSLKEYIKELKYDYPITRRFENDFVVHSDYRSKYINIENGIRKTCYQPEKYTNTIYFIGPCFSISIYTDDEGTIPSCLSKLLKEKDFSYRVVNLGSFASNDIDEYIEQLSLKDGDIIVNTIASCYEKVSGFIEAFDPSEYFNKIPNRPDMFYDNFAHVNKKGNEIYAKAIFDNIEKYLCKDKQKLTKTNIYDVFKNNYKDLEIYDFEKYINIFKEENKKIPKGSIVGSIVMNCNPFTLGHEYLVEYARANCDHLVIFVVEEDKSYFKAKDRIAIAKAACADKADVSVLPSGNCVGSYITIPEYFQREQIRENNDTKEFILYSVLDLRVFASYIAPIMGIKRRFIAEEPLDNVTKQYNQHMKKVLPNFGIEVFEIERKALDDGDVVSASKVRKMYKERDFENMKKMLPKSTFDYLIEHKEQYLGKE